MVDTVVDYQALLAALPTGQGTGEDLRSDYSPNALYQRLRDARAEARAEERSRDSLGETDAPVPQGWRLVQQLGIQALQQHSKDLEVAAWLTEALLRIDGLDGLTQGARLLAGLLETFWDEVFPLPDEDGLEMRAAPLGGLAGADADGTLMQALRRTPLYRRPNGEALALYQYEASREAEALADETRRAARFAQGVVPLDTVRTEASLDRAGLARLAAAAHAARGAWSAFEAQLDQRFGRETPPSRRVSEVLDRLIGVTAELGLPESAAADMTTEAMAAGSPASAATAAAPGISLVPGNLASREQALQLLERIAEYFRSAEPHSFLAYTLTDAARRGRMSLPELLAEVLQDETARSSMLTALGIRPPESA